MRILTFIVLSLLIQQLFGQSTIQFSGPEVRNVSNASNSNWLKELNQDNYLEFIQVNTTGVSISTNINDTQFSSTIQQPLSTELVIVVEPTDLDNDNLLDLVYTEYADSNRQQFTISWRKNLGNHQFSAPQVIDYSINHSYFLPMHINGDSLIDLVPSSFSNSIAFAYLNQGNGQFIKQIYSGNSRSFYNSFSIDMGSDGDMDIVAYDGYYKTYIYEQHLDSFSIVDSILNTRHYTKTPLKIDIDADNDDDVFIFESLGSFKILENTTTYPYIKSHQSSLNFSKSISSLTFATQDITQDNLNDLLVIAEDNNSDSIFALVNTGNMNFTVEFVGTIPAQYSDYQFLDMNNDGRLDIVSIYNNQLYWWEQQNVVTSTQEGLEAKLSPRIYPNPSTDVIYIECNTDNLIELFDAKGQLLHQQNTQNQQSQISLRDLAKGIYFIRINQQNSYPFIKK